MTLAPGQSLSFYEILGPLGAGGMGEVYRARDTRLERIVALKVLPEEMAADSERLARFEREAKVLAALQHPNIVTVHSVEEVDGVHFLTMELVEGSTLGTAIEPGGMPLAKFYPLAAAIAEAVHVAHKKGITHRDLKPDNVILDASGRPTVLDFGLAKLERKVGDDGKLDSSLTDAGRVMGTLPYMAPEALKGEEVDSRADVFSLGVVLFEALTGRHPFPGEDTGERMSAILRDAPPRADELRRDVPPGLARLLERSLAKDPDRRLQTALDLRNELEELAAAGDTTAPAEARAGAGRRLVLGMGAVALLVTAAIWFARLSNREEPVRAAFSSRPLTFSQLFDRDPTWSPGGEWIAFSRQKSASMGLWLKDVATGDEIERRDGPGDEVCPRWSPDGQYIAILSTDLPGTPVVLVRPRATGSGGERVLIDTQMGVLDIITQWGAMGVRPWAEDGSSLLVSRLTDTGQAVVFRVGRDDDLLEPLTSPPIGSDDFYASYSFDQEQILFVRRTQGRGALMLMPAEGGDPEVLLDDGRLIGLASWRPDGQNIVYITPTGLWEIDVDTRTSRRLLFASDQSSHHGELSVSAGGRIAYSVGGHATTLTVLDLESGSRRAVTDHDGTNFGCRYSPNGEIAYHSDRTGDSEIWVIAPDGEERRITHDTGADTSPDWSPDGERLVFRSNRDGAFKIYVSDSNGGDCHLLWNRELSGAWMGLLWSPRSAAGELIGCLVAEEGGDALWGVRPDGTGARRLHAGVVGFDWYLDSTRVLATLDDGRGEKLVAVHLETGEVKEIWTGPHDEIDVAPDGRSVMFAMGLGHAAMGRAILELVPPESPDGLPTARGEPEYVVRADGPWHTHHGAWAADSKSIVYVHDDDRSNIYELIAAD